MTLPVVPGSSMSFSQINTELGLSSTATISLNDAAVRTLAGVGASPATIAITNLSGKSNQFAFTISSNQTNANLRTLAVNAGWPGTAKVVATINSGIYVYSTSTGSAALTINGSFPNGVELINNGIIAGMGGNGGNGQRVFIPATVGNGTAGGLALAVSVAVTINNLGTIGGGGGGGGGGSYSFNYSNYNSGGGGGGGGGRVNGTGGTGEANDSGGGSGTNGGNGSLTAAGGGGTNTIGSPRSSGGVGGDLGAVGSNGTIVAGGQRGTGGAAGGAITGNSNITYINTGTRLGSIS